ncbi:MULTISPECIES: hypothetical protein [unclassified Spirosoma]|uniref:hypothetical protein n=1 Tax=unclassified Spirosoma TaxID=2621999 RepID=UPI00095CA585|nr:MULTISPECIES: hypothetical protein [unclassified Spirosoma]MBN8822823.1 hypothetical protein [Spirosoma sp.]OJW80023.1 MAG: hypothetical protein BGO59_02090 [Spirosoma sp. 48-14]
MMKQRPYLTHLLISLFTLGASLTACQQQTKHTESSSLGDSLTAQSATQPDTLCFQQIEGKDSTLLQVVRNGSAITGRLEVLPFEKDRASGTLKGTESGNQITADWQRSGEGMTQTYEVVFTLKGDAITWREGERIEKQGKWVLKDPAQGYDYTLMKTDCH